MRIATAAPCELTGAGGVVVVVAGALEVPVGTEESTDEMTDASEELAEAARDETDAEAADAAEEREAEAEDLEAAETDDAEALEADEADALGTTVLVTALVDDDDATADEDAAGGLTYAMTIRISSHCAPIHWSYRL